MSNFPPPSAWSNVNRNLLFGFALDPCGNIIQKSAFQKKTAFGWDTLTRRQEKDVIYPVHWKAAARNRAVRNATPVNLQDDLSLRTGYSGARTLVASLVGFAVVFVTIDFLKTDWFVSNVLGLLGYGGPPVEPSELPEWERSRRVIKREIPSSVK